MTKSEEITSLIKLHSHEELLGVWEKIIEKPTPLGWEKGIVFEFLILRAFEIGGADVTYPYGVFNNDGVQIEQIDGVVYFKHLSCLIECKNYDEKSPIDFSPLVKMRSQLLRRPSSTIGSFFSVSGFTEPAVILAGYLAPQTILLWESSEIYHVLTNNCICNALIEKYKKYIEKCQPDYNTSSGS